MIRSFRAVVALAVVAPAVAVAQVPASAYTLSPGCAGGQCRPVAAVTGAVHQTVVHAGDVVRGVYPDGSRTRDPLPAVVPGRMAQTYVPGQPVRNVGRAVRQLFGR